MKIKIEIFFSQDIEIEIWGAHAMHCKLATATAPTSQSKQIGEQRKRHERMDVHTIFSKEFKWLENGEVIIALIDEFQGRGHLAAHCSTDKSTCTLLHLHYFIFQYIYTSKMYNSLS